MRRYRKALQWHKNTDNPMGEKEKEKLFLIFKLFFRSFQSAASPTVSSPAKFCVSSDLGITHAPHQRLHAAAQARCRLSLSVLTVCTCWRASLLPPARSCLTSSERRRRRFESHAESTPGSDLQHKERGHMDGASANRPSWTASSHGWNQPLNARPQRKEAGGKEELVSQQQNRTAPPLFLPPAEKQVQIPSAFGSLGKQLRNEPAEMSSAARRAPATELRLPEASHPSPAAYHVSS